MDEQDDYTINALSRDKQLLEISGARSRSPDRGSPASVSRKTYQIVDATAVTGRWDNYIMKPFGAHPLDLASATQSETHLAFINANLNRRQLDQLQRVRAAIRAYEWQYAKGGVFQFGSYTRSATRSVPASA